MEKYLMMITNLGYYYDRKFLMMITNLGLPMTDDDNQYNLRLPGKADNSISYHSLAKIS
jgi:hypothetical protein